MMASFLKWRLAAAVVLWLATVMAFIDFRKEQTAGLGIAVLILLVGSIFLTYLYWKKG